MCIAEDGMLRTLHTMIAASEVYLILTLRLHLPPKEVSLDNTNIFTSLLIL